jgi:hypothetical protein
VCAIACACRIRLNRPSPPSLRCVDENDRVCPPTRTVVVGAGEVRRLVEAAAAQGAAVDLVQADQVGADRLDLRRDPRRVDDTVAADPVVDVELQHPDDAATADRASRVGSGQQGMRPETDRLTERSGRCRGRGGRRRDHRQGGARRRVARRAGCSDRDDDQGGDSDEGDDRRRRHPQGTPREVEAWSGTVRHVPTVPDAG